MSDFAREYIEELEDFKALWDRKRLLREEYGRFHRLISNWCVKNSPIVELGSGIGSLRETIAECLTTDFVKTPWSSRAESAYKLSFQSGTVGSLVLFDVFHHLRYPGLALDEFYRVLLPGGRVILFEPCLSILGLIVYGVFHREPIAIGKAIKWRPDITIDPFALDTYAAQGNAYRVFIHEAGSRLGESWKIVNCTRLSALTYLGSGGYRSRQLIPDFAASAIRLAERGVDLFPSLFATRLLVVLEKLP